MRASILAIFLIFLPSWAFAASLLINGQMDAELLYELRYEVQAPPGLERLALSFVEPQAYGSRTYSQDIQAQSLRFSPEPDARTRTQDNRGNSIVTATWAAPPARIEAVFALHARTRTSLDEVRSTAPFPLSGAGPELAPYLSPTPLVQSQHADIIKLSHSITQNAQTELDAVRSITYWVVDNLTYVNPYDRYDALHTLGTRKGNCQNFSHLAAALLRAARIPARIVNGYTLNQPYSVQTTGAEFTTAMAMGRHSWIEVWFPDLGWTPFDPQNSMLFVANRYLRSEVGVDNQDTGSDGQLSWIVPVRGGPPPQVREIPSVSFPRDLVRLRGELRQDGPRNLMRQPAAAPALAAGDWDQSGRRPQPQPPAPAAPGATAPAPPPARGGFTRAVALGNTVFPEDVDFTLDRTVRQTGKREYSAFRSFLVESAEYVTTNLTQYAQFFSLPEALRLTDIALALHRYGGEGQLWVEVLADAGGEPGEVLAVSSLLDLGQLSLRPGYRWASFAFPAPAPVLAPGGYWLALGYTGDAVLNWFYSYAGAADPLRGARYKPVGAPRWSGALSCSFIHRVRGLAQAR